MAPRHRRGHGAELTLPTRLEREPPVPATPYAGAEGTLSLMVILPGGPLGGHRDSSLVQLQV